MVDLQCCISFLSTVVTQLCIYYNRCIIFHILFQFDFSQDTEYSSLCYIVGLWCLSIIYIIFASANPNLLTLPSSTHLLPFGKEEVCSLCL